MEKESPILKFLAILVSLVFLLVVFGKSCGNSYEPITTIKKTEKEKDSSGSIYKLSEKEEIAKDPKSYLKLTHKSWRLDGFGIISMQNFDIENTSSIDMKDVSIKFTYYSESGTVLSESINVVYKNIKAKSKIKVREFNAGFVNQQTASCQLQIVDAVAIVVYD
jgi:hypothetical protein